LKPPTRYDFDPWIDDNWWALVDWIFMWVNVGLPWVTPEKVSTSDKCVYIYIHISVATEIALPN
jgi:hypothetical protein